MSTGKWIVRAIVVFITANVMGFLGHGLWLHPYYMTLTSMMRGEQDQQRYYPWLLLGFLFYSFALVWIYAQGNSGKAWLGQGVRFGVAVWALASVPTYLINYSVAPWPGGIIARQIGWDLVASLVVGIVIAALSKKDAAVARAA
jgi:hypothetical protein